MSEVCDSASWPQIMGIPKLLILVPRIDTSQMIAFNDGIIQLKGDACWL